MGLEGQPPRVLLFLTGSLQGGGSEKVLLEHLRALDRSRFRPEVLALEAGGENRARYREAEIEVAGVADRRERGNLLWGLVRAIRARLRRQDVSLVHAWLGLPAVVGPGVARWVSRTPVIVSQRNLGYWLGRPQRRLYRWSNHRYVDRMAVNAEAVRESLVAEGLCPRRIIEVIPNGIDLERFRPAGDRGEARRALGLPSSGPVVGLVGSLKTIKGHVDILDALEPLHGRGISPQVVLVGSGKEEPALRERVAGRPWAERVHFLGRRTDVERIYPALDVSLLCSRTEGLPNVVIEAMACGCPVVGARVGGVPEVLEEGREGFLYTPGRPEELAEALAPLLTDDEMRERMGRLARERAEARFGFSRMQADFESLYASLLEDPS
jgi:glycosyltransferase involved in cell wall biosynthesis